MAAKFQDYYEILGINRDSSEKDVKSAYRNLARKWHPDLHPESEKSRVEEKFKRIKEAYEVLSDPEKRARYDRLGSRWQNGEEFQAPPDMEGTRYYTTGDFRSGDSDFSDFFEMIFGGMSSGRAGGRGGRTVRTRGEDIETGLNLSVEEAYRGTVKTFRLSANAVCTECGGTAIVGRGLCPRCRGTGSVPEEKTIEVKVPAGVREGSRIRLKGQGGSGLGGAPKGDLFLKIQILPHPFYRLKGNDIESDIILRPEQAVLGDRITVQTLDGPVSMTVPAGTNTGKRLRLRGKGFPGKQNKRGDHYVKAVIKIPQEISDTEKDLYRQIHNMHGGK